MGSLAREPSVSVAGPSARNELAHENLFNFFLSPQRPSHPHLHSRDRTAGSSLRPARRGPRALRILARVLALLAPAGAPSGGSRLERRFPPGFAPPPTPRVPRVLGTLASPDSEPPPYLPLLTLLPSTSFAATRRRGRRAHEKEREREASRRPKLATRARFPRPAGSTLPIAFPPLMGAAAPPRGNVPARSPRFHLISEAIGSLAREREKKRNSRTSSSFFTPATPSGTRHNPPRTDGRTREMMCGGDARATCAM